jgi:hypothetical protein
MKRRRFLQHCAATAGGVIVPGLVLPEIARPANVALHLSPKPGGGGGGGELSSDLVLVLRTTSASQTIAIPCKNSGTFNAQIDWGDGSSVANITAYNDVDLEHTFASAGDHEVTISGDFPNLYYNNGTYKDTIIRVEDSAHQFLYAQGAFYGCSNLEYIGADFSLVTESVYYFARGTPSLVAVSDAFNFNSTSDMYMTFRESDLSAYPSNDFASCNRFTRAWYRNYNLADFAANCFDNMQTPATGCFDEAWESCSLTAQSVENILVSIDTSGHNAPAVPQITIGFDTGTGSLSSATTTAITSLKGKGWDVVINGVSQ